MSISLSIPNQVIDEWSSAILPPGLQGSHLYGQMSVSCPELLLGCDTLLPDLYVITEN